MQVRRATGDHPAGGGLRGRSPEALQPWLVGSGRHTVRNGCRWTPAAVNSRGVGVVDQQHVVDPLPARVSGDRLPRLDPATGQEVRQLLTQSPTGAEPADRPGGSFPRSPPVPRTGTQRTHRLDRQCRHEWGPPAQGASAPGRWGARERRGRLAGAGTRRSPACACAPPGPVPVGTVDRAVTANEPGQVAPACSSAYPGPPATSRAAPPDRRCQLGEGAGVEPLARLIGFSKRGCA